MKKIISSIFITLLCFSLQAQSKITGFGKIQLGMSIDQIPELSKAKPLSDYTKYLTDVYENTANQQVFELIPDTNSTSTKVGSLDKRVRKFTVPKLNVTDNIVLELVELTFFDNKLIRIKCGYDKTITEALTLKYGEPKVDTQQKEVQFTYTNTGATVTKVETRIRSNWETGDANFNCESYLSKFYTSKGKELFVTYVKLEDKTYDESISSEEKLVEDRLKKKEEDMKKQKMSGF